MELFYNASRNFLTDETGDRIDFLPRIAYGDSPQISMTVYWQEEIQDDLSTASYWKGVVDIDRNYFSNPMCVIESGDFELTGNVLEFEFDTETTEFFMQTNGKSNVPVICELCGYNTNDEVIFRFAFPMIGVMPVDNGNLPSNSPYMVVPSGVTMTLLPPDRLFVDTYIYGTVTGSAYVEDCTIFVKSGGLFDLDAESVTDDFSLVVESGGFASGWFHNLNSVTVQSGGVLSSSYLGGTINMLLMGLFEKSYFENGILTVVGGTMTSTFGDNYNLILRGGAQASLVSMYTGTVDIFVGGNLNGLTMESGGTVNIYSGATAIGIAQNQDGIIIVNSGGVASSMPIQNSGIIIVSSGGIASSIEFLDGGTGNILFGGSYVGGMVYGRADVSIGGYVQNINIAEGGKITIDGSGAVCSNINIGQSGMIESEFQHVGNDAAYVQKFAMGDGGYLALLGIASNLNIVTPWAPFHVSDGGILDSSCSLETGDIRMGGGTASGFVVNGGEIHFYDDASGDGVVVNSGGVIFPNENVSNLIVNSGGAVRIDDGLVFNSFSVNSGVNLTIQNGEANYINVASGGVVDIISGTINSTTLAGTLEVYNDGVANATVIGSGGELNVYGTEANDITINSGGHMNAFDGSYINIIELNSDGSLNIRSGVNANALVINSGASLTVFSESEVSSVEVNSGGSMLVSGGTVFMVTMESGASMTASSAAEFYGGTIQSGAIAAFNKTTVTGMTIPGRINAYNSCSFSHCIIQSGGVIQMFSPCWGYGNIVSGGQERLEQAGIHTTGTTVFSGYQNIAPNAVASNTVLSGGMQSVSSTTTGAGSAVATIVFAGILQCNGWSSDAIIKSGGSLTVGANGIALDVTSETGAVINVASGGSITYK